MNIVRDLHPLRDCSVCEAVLHVAVVEGDVYTCVLCAEDALRNQFEILRDTQDPTAFRVKDRLYAFRDKFGLFCFSCGKKVACVYRDSHHVGDCCIHCGNDKRGPNATALPKNTLEFH